MLPSASLSFTIGVCFLCCPSTHLFSPHHTSLCALYSWDVCALNPYRPFKLPWCLLCSPLYLSTPTPTLLHPLPILLHLHLVSTLPSVFFYLCPVMPQHRQAYWEPTPTPTFCTSLASTSWSLMLGGMNVSRPGGPPSNEQSNTHTQLGKETALLWCEDRWLPLLIVLSIT